MAPSSQEPFDADATRVPRPAGGVGASTGGGSAGGGTGGASAVDFDAEATVVVGVLRPGEVVFGRYRLESVVGRGGMGVVWSALDQELGTTVALKFLPEIVARDAGSLVDLKRETRRSRDLTHTHIVRIHDFHSDGQRAAISMELLTGGTLAERLAQRREEGPGCFEVAEIETWVRQIVEALAYAHGEGVVHRDLKPANLLLDAQGRIKVSDFGVAASLTDSVSRVSRVAGTSGTPCYMSPQQMRGRPPAAADDVYAFGATLYELMTGRPPFHSGNVAIQVLQEPATPLTDRRAELRTGCDPIPVAWEQAILACLAKDPGQRPRSMRAAMADLSGEAGPDDVAETRKGPAASQPVRSRAGTLPPSRPPSPTANAVGGLMLDTIPPKAEVRLGGLRVVTAPVREGNLPCGPLAVEIRAPGCRVLRTTVEIMATTFIELGNLKLEPQQGELMVQTVPPSLQWIALETPTGVGSLKGIGGDKAVKVPPGEYRIGLDHGLWKDVTSELTIEDAERTEVSLVCRTGELTVRTEPAAFPWHAVDGPQALQGIGGSSHLVTPGRYRIAASRAGWPDTATEVVIGAGEQSDVVLTFDEATLDVKVWPVGALVEVVGLEKRDVGEGNKVRFERLPPGPVQLRFGKFGHCPFVWEGSLKAGRQGIPPVRLEPEPWSLALMEVERLQQQASLALRIVFPLLSFIEQRRVKSLLEQVERASATLAEAEEVARREGDAAAGAAIAAGRTDARRLLDHLKRLARVHRLAAWPVLGAWSAAALLVAGIGTSGLQPIPKPADARVIVLDAKGRSLEQPFKRVWPGTYRVVVDDARFERTAITVRAQAFRNLTIPVAAERAFGDLLLSIEGREAAQSSVEVNGHAAPVDLGGRLRLPAGEVHRVVVSSPRHFAFWEGSVMQGTETRAELRVTPRPGTLELTVSPTHAPWELWVDGRNVGRQGRYELPAETALALEVRAARFNAETRTLTLAAAGSDAWRVELTEAPVPASGAPWTVALAGLPPEVKPLEMVWIRPGSFLMGSPATEAGRDSDEGPQTRVTLSRGFWLGKYEVTQAQWRALMASNPAHFQNAGVNAPVENVSWDQVMEFCRKLTEQERAAERLPEGHRYTLPTEAQWEYAARAGTTGPYGVSGNLEQVAWYSENSGNSTKAVGQKRANDWGLHDIYGNVWEWCAGWYGNYPGGSVTDLSGPSSGTHRVRRGGSWGSDAPGCRSALRTGDAPGNRFRILGFRLALSSSP